MSVSSFLHEFDLQLCTHVVCNVRWNLDAYYVHDRISHLPPPLAKHLIDQCAQDVRFAPTPSLLLNSDELLTIADAIRFLPVRSERYWCCTDLSEATLCTGEIRRRLAAAEA